MAIRTELQIQQRCVCFCRWIFGLPQGDFLRAHAETAIKSHERERLEKLVRTMARPAISDERVIIEGPQSSRVKLKSRWTDGTESLLFTPSEFLERLVRWSGFSSTSGRFFGKKTKIAQTKRISWAQLLKRTFKIDVFKCEKCGGRMKLVGVVFDQPTITTTLRALSLPVRVFAVFDPCTLGWVEIWAGCTSKRQTRNKVRRRLTKKWGCEG